MSDVTIPPHHRRRDSDRVSPKRIGIGTAFGVIAALGAARPGLDLYADFRAAVENSKKVTALEEKARDYDQMKERVLNLEKKNESLTALLNDADNRLEILERWQCRLGWNPPTSRDPNKECR